MNRETPLKNVVYFLCSPSLGLLDNWLSVLWSLKEKRDDLKFAFIIPKASSIDQIQLSNILLILGAKIFDGVVYKSNADHWLQTNTFSQLNEKNESRKIERFLVKVIKKLKKRKIFSSLGNLIQYVYDKLYKFQRRNELYDWEIVKKHGACMLFDVYEESKPYNAELMEIFRKIPKFSIQHGINIDVGGGIENAKEVSGGGSRKDVKAYLFSPMEQASYINRYNIHKSFIEVVGVPRHTPEWMEFIRLNMLDQMSVSSSLKNGSIFIISRPGGTNYHPYKRKKKALENIKQLAWNDLKKNIVVKLHPKERKEGLYEEVFGTDTYGDKWFYSDIHPFVLGKESAFAISFYSGVPIDMLALGVPTIEYLDLRGIPDFDNDESLRDKKGHPCFGYRYLDLVLGASDYDQMKAHAMEIMNDRETVLSRLQAKYNELFPQIENINEKIAKDILSISSKGSE